MRILQVNNYGYMRGGSERYFFDICDMLEKNGHTVTSFSAGVDINQHVSESITIEEKSLYGPTLKVAKRYIFDKRNQNLLREYLQKHTVDLAHLHIYYGQITTSILQVLKEFKIPIIQTLHEYKLVCPNAIMYCKQSVCESCTKNKLFALKNRCNKNSFTRSLAIAMESKFSEWMGSISSIDHFISISDFQKNKLAEYGIPKYKMTTVHNFSKDPSNASQNSSEDYFLFYGRIERLKGIFTLIEASAEVPEIPLVVAGIGKGVSEIKSIIKEKNLNHISMVGFQNGKDLSELIKGSICTVLPSEWHEPFGLTITESFAFGKPVICSKMGGMIELVDHKKDGLFFDPMSSVDLKDKLKWMRDNRMKAREMGNNGRLKYEKKFSEEIHYNNIIDVYSRFI